jgi:8-oxo-dGTP diphosphatase
MPMSEYLTSIRKRIGSDLLLTPAAGVAVFDDRDRLLLARHVDTGMWATVGGAMDPDESPADAALRELAEETGLSAEIVGLVGAYGGPSCRITYPNGDQTSYVAIIYAARLVGGEPVLQRDEIEEIGWFTAEEADALPKRAEMHDIVPDSFAAWAARS